MREARVRVGVLGCGTIAYWQHLRNLKRMSSVQVTGLADPDTGALARAARRVQAPTFRDAEELLSQQGLDAVLIASPAGLHAEHVAAACRANLHIYVEKPLAHDAASLASLHDRTRDVDRVLAIGYNYRFHPACRRLRHELETRTIGEVHALLSHFTESADPSTLPDWRRSRRAGGGVLLDLATHHIDLYRWLLQDDVVDIRTATRSRLVEEDSAWVRGVTRRGIELCGYFARGGSRSHAIAVHGTRGILHFDLHTGNLMVSKDRRMGYGVRSRRLAPGFETLYWQSRKRVQPSYDPSHARALQAFVDAVANPDQRDPDLATFDDGSAALSAILNAEERNANTPDTPFADSGTP